MEFNLKVDPEFQGKIPPLSEAEFAQLEENILEAGKVYEPIVVWNGTIVDGHNRYKIVQKHPEILWETREMSFADKWAAFDWMFRNQLGRRNLTDEQRTYVLGKLYEARKHVRGGTGANQYTKVQNPQSGDLAKKRTVDEIAAEQNVGANTVDRAGQYARGIDAIRSDDPELADAILEGKKKVLKSTVRDAGKAIPEVRGKIIKAIKDERKPVPRKSKEEIRKNQEDIEQIERYVEESRTVDGEAVMTITDLIADIKSNSEPYVRLLGRILSGYADVVKENLDTVIQAIDDFAINEINNIKERIKNDYA